MLKRWGLVVLTIWMAFGSVMLSQAAETKIDKVTVTFSYSSAPKAGSPIGDVTAKTSSNKFTIDSAGYTNDDEKWSLGDRPVVKVEMTAADGYRFAYTSSSHFSLSGGKAEFKKARISDSGRTLELEAYLKTVGGKLGEVSDLRWDETVARWDRMSEAASYEVALYRGSKSVTTVKIDGLSYDFSGYMDKEGDYKFRVRAVAKYDGKAGDWSEYSDEYYVDEEEAQYNDSRGTWMRNQYGWWYSYKGGGYPSSCWKNIDNSWYYFDRSGYMLTGWQQLDGKWYYLSGSGAMVTGWQYINNRWYYLNGDGTMRNGGWQYINGRWYYLEGSGAMLTGWQYINGRWYYLDGSGAMLTDWQYINGRWYYLDGSGAMLTNWQNINGRWYYLDGNGVMLTGWQDINGAWYCLDSNGAMYANTTTPDGYRVDASGRRIQ